MILYCKNKAVYDINKEKVLNKDLLPGLMRKNPCNHSFNKWLMIRYSSTTNSLARRLKDISFGRSQRVSVNRFILMLSLSDNSLEYDRLIEDLVFVLLTMKNKNAVE